MSSFYRITRHPVTKKWEKAFWIDNYFKHYHYGCKFSNGDVFDPWKQHLDIADITNEEMEILNKYVENNSG